MADAAHDREHIRIEPDAPGDADTAPGAGLAARTDLTKRFVAGVIDAVLAVLVGLIPVVGGLIAAAYWLVRDGMELEFMDRRSVGKKLVKLRPVRDDGRPMDIATSVQRNWPFAIGGLAQVLLFIPILGWLLMIPVAVLALAAVVVECVMVVTQPDSRRFGDRWAGTRVVEVTE